ncbi:ATP-binding cassette sub-family C member 4-like [Clytia hemisphaerica]|uniref:Uncharacterized protein n=1 Tax=Clytia hemisphaerica TaxID=252671 RepID=A0A7M6DLN7_9CNID
MEQGNKDPETWAPDDSIAKEKDVSSSFQKEDNNSHLDFEDNSKEHLMEEEVLIKPDSKPPPDPDNRKWSPRRNAFFFSKFVSFFWMRKLFIKGSKSPLEQDDLEGMNPDDCAAPLTEQLERNWHQEAYDENGKMKANPSLMKAIVKTYAFQYLIVGFFPACCEVIRLIQPIFLGLLIDFFAVGNSTKSQAYSYAFAIVACHFTASWCYIPFNYLKTMAGVNVRVGVTGLIFKKILGVNSKLSTLSTGQIVNIVSNDTFRFEIASLFFHYIWLAPIQFIILSILLYRELGPSAFAGIGVLVLLTPIQLAFGNIVKRFRQKIFKHSDERVKVMNEIINGIKVIKLYTWEKSFKEWIKDLREKEIKSVQYLAYARATIMSFFFSAGAFVSLITFMTFVLSGNKLTAQIVFTSVALFNIARGVFTIYLPIGVTFMMEVNVAVQRIQKILTQEDIDPTITNSAMRPKPHDCSVIAENLHASWEEGSDSLKGINFKVKSGELMAVVGPVGSGKSSLLMAILGELPLDNGEVMSRGKIAYSSQEAWIFNGTIKYNITFGQHFNEERYNEVIKACALQRDLEILPLGDQTIVGERGVSLSGGQKARVNLARAVYADADIYIMDDPLSAVDAHVGRELYDKCVNGFLKDKVRILVTHQLQYLGDADEILALVDGRCVAQGTFQQLNDAGLEFWNLIHDEKKTPEQQIDELIDEEMYKKRRFSRVMSHDEDGGGVLLRKRAISFGRQVSKSSRCNFGESTATVAGDVSQCVVYEEKTEEVIPIKETKQGGAVGTDVYVRYFKSGPGKLKWVFTIFLIVITQVIFQFADFWLAEWSNNEEKSNRKGETYADRSHDLGIYALLTVLLIVLGLARALTFFKMMISTANGVHMKMFKSVMRAPLFFFDTNSAGRILNRFSKDTSLIDDMLPFSAFQIMQNFFIIFGLLVLISIKMAIFLVLLVPIVIVFIMLRMYYIKTARELKRIEGIARSPVFGHFSTTMLGLPTIRAFRVQDKFFDLFAEVQDKHTEAYFTFVASTGWLGFNLDLISGLLVIFTSFVTVAFSDSFDGQAGTVGLLLTYAVGVAPLLQFFVQQSTEVENYFTSVERVFEYSDLESEAPRKTNVRPSKEWPKRGSITFDRLQFSYHRTLPNVLHCITAKIHSNEKIGVCGRTGAGKSSLLSTIFRTAEPSGKIFIDDQDILQLGLDDLRKKLSIIPQEPILFSGTLRYNLDPFNKYNDKDLWDCLHEVQLKDAVLELPGKLDSEMKESGNNLSVGQRQLICLARAILKHNRVLVIDEATANVDPKTDSLIQETIREKFKECTVLTIAHRLHTIMDSDRIMVLDAGYLKEFEEPYRLLRCKGTLLYGLVKQTGHDEAQRLFEMAIKAHCDRHKKAHVAGLLGDCQGGCKCKDGVCPVTPMPLPSPEIVVSAISDEKTQDENPVESAIDQSVEQPDQEEVRETSVDDTTIDETEDSIHADTSTLLPTTEL